MATRTRLPLQSLFHKNGPLFRSERAVQTEAADREPAYPPVVPSLTAKSKSAAKQRIDKYLERVRAASVQDKLSLLTSKQRKKYVVYPQSFARNADKWYQHFTKTAYIPGLPEKFTFVEETKEDSPPGTQKVPSPIIEEDVFVDIRSHVSHAILQEHWYMKKRKPFLQKEQEHNVAPLLRNLVSGLTNHLVKHNPVLQHSSLGMIDSLSH